MSLFNPLGRCLLQHELETGPAGLGVKHVQFASPNTLLISGIDSIGFERGLMTVLGYGTPLKFDALPTTWSTRFAIGVGKQWNRILDPDVPTYKQIDIAKATGGRPVLRCTFFLWGETNEV